MDESTLHMHTHMFYYFFKLIFYSLYSIIVPKVQLSACTRFNLYWLCWEKF